MKSKSIILGLVLLIPIGTSAQNGAVVIRGTIYGPQGETVPYMPIQATKTGSGEFGRDESSTEGQYELSNLATGSYTLTITTPCCAYSNYKSDVIEVGAGAVKQFDIHLREGGSFNTVGDDPGNIAASIRSQAVIPDEPPPRMPDGEPDLSGMWLIGVDPFPQVVDAQDWAQELYDERLASRAIDHPHLRCLPGNPPIPGGAAPFMAKFVQTADLLVILFEDVPGFRQVFMNGQDHPEDPDPTWMGHSIGHWDGDTLVVETVGFNDRGWIAFYPRTEALRMVERYTRPEYGRMDIEVIYDDPAVYNAPWKENIPLHLAPQEELIEFVCENNKWAEVSGN